MRERYAKLLLTLQEEKGYIKGHELAEKLGVSARTIRTDVKDLNENYLTDARIVTNQTMGYRL